jgi:broad specificity phosphatase PhoE
VRRRKPEEGAPGGVPERLRRFAPGEWPGETIWEKSDAWNVARNAWSDEHGDWPGSLGELIASFDLVPPEPFDPYAIYGPPGVRREAP